MQCGDLFRARTALTPDSYFSATKIEWILQNAPKCEALHQENRLRAGNMDRKYGMKKVFTIIGFCCLVAIIAVGMYMALSSKTIDFRGTVTKIETIDNNIIFEIAMHDVTYTVTANAKTKVAYCHEDDPAINLSDIKVGDTIEGNYCKFSKDKLAKTITVWMVS